LGPDNTDEVAFAMRSQCLLDLLSRRNEGGAANLGFAVIVRECDYGCAPQRNSCHMGKGFHETCIAGYDNPFLDSAFVKDQRVSFGLLVKVVVHAHIESFRAKLLCKTKGSEIPVDKKPWLRRLSGPGSI
jgi:hypothetical protein